jgi:Methylase involved in ubiquinone/menaquinone biosynthesis
MTFREPYYFYGFVSMSDLTNMKIIEEAFAPMEGKVILDVGCGSGALLKALIKRGAKVHGLDPEPSALEASQSRAPTAHLRQAGLEDAGYQDKIFDGVVILNSLHHVPENHMGAALDEALRILKPEGALVVIEPLARGDHFAVMQPLEDETDIRADAITSLQPFWPAMASRRSSGSMTRMWIGRCRPIDPESGGRRPVTISFCCRARPAMVGFLTSLARWCLAAEIHQP